MAVVEVGTLELEQIAAERTKLRRRAEQYYLPLFKRLTAAEPGPVRILSVGCGIAEDVDVLQDAGFLAFGADSGYRWAEWKQRRSRTRLLRANGCCLPFGDASFDLVSCSGVIEHVGAVGSSLQLQPDYYQQRIRFARELVRVTKPGGDIIMDTPNKQCPVDPWHGPFRFGGRWHSPWEKFSVGYHDLYALFVEQAGAQAAEPLSIRGFFLFENARRFAVGRGIELISRLLFGSADCPGLRWLRTSCLMPYLVVRILR